MTYTATTTIPFDAFASQDGEQLDALSRRSPMLVVFLRHAGCPFCREALAELRDKRDVIERGGTAIALVHMTTESEAAALFARYGLEDVPRFADPDRRLYRAFGLRRESAWNVMGPRVWWSGFKTVLSGHLPGTPRGDVFQMPGTFLLVDGEIVKRFHNRHSGDRPDYESLAVCPIELSEPESQRAREPESQRARELRVES